MAEDTKKPGTSKKTSTAKASSKTKEPVSKSKETAEDVHARVEAEKKALDEIITGNSSAAEKKKAIDEIKKKIADDIIKSKPSVKDNRSAEEIKKKAAEAKKARVKILDQSYVHDPNDHLERLANSFDTSARRWEMVVYPTLFAFILLAGYGFFLIYRLTHDIAVLSESVTSMAIIVSDSMPKMTRDIRGMTDSVDSMTSEVGSMSNQMTSLTPMSHNIANMTGSMHQMNRSVYGMQRDIGGMNRTVSGGPFGFMNDMMPFTSDSYSTPPPPLPPMQQPMYTQPNQWGSYPYAATQRQPQKSAPVKKNDEPATKSPVIVEDGIVNNKSSTNVVKKN